MQMEITDVPKEAMKKRSNLGQCIVPNSNEHGDVKKSHSVAGGGEGHRLIYSCLFHRRIMNLDIMIHVTGVCNVHLLVWLYAHVYVRAVM